MKDLKYLQLFDCYGGLFTEHQRDVCRLYYVCDLSLAEIAEEITKIVANHSQVDWTNNKTIHDRISQDIDDLFYDYEKERGLKLSFDTIDKIIENVKTVALRRF